MLFFQKVEALQQLISRFGEFNKTNGMCTTCSDSNAIFSSQVAEFRDANFEFCIVSFKCCVELI